MSWPDALSDVDICKIWLASPAPPSQSSASRNDASIGQLSACCICSPAGVSVGVPSTRYGFAHAATAESAVAISTV